MEKLGAELAVESVCFSSSGEKVTNWNIQGRILGQDVVVNVGNSSIDEFLKELPQLKGKVLRLEAENTQMRVENQERDEKIHKLEKKNEELNEIVARSNTKRIGNLSAQLLLGAAGEQLRQSKSARFKSLGVQNEGVKRLAASLDATPEEVIDNADRVLTRRNKTFHFKDLAQLDKEVEEVVKIITPEMQRCRKWECNFILNSKALKEAFPQGFTEQKS